MFYVRELGGEQLCGRRILCKFRGRWRERERGRERERERERELIFSWRSGAECQRQRAAVYLQTKARLSYYITIIPGDNTSHAAAAVI